MNPAPVCTLTTCYDFNINETGNPIFSSCQSYLGPVPVNVACPIVGCVNMSDCIGDPAPASFYNSGDWTRPANSLKCADGSLKSPVVDSQWFCVRSDPCVCVYVGGTNPPVCAAVPFFGNVLVQVTKWKLVAAPGCAVPAPPE